jgi:hypothetical protein
MSSGLIVISIVIISKVFVCNVIISIDVVSSPVCVWAEGYIILIVDLFNDTGTPQLTKEFHSADPTKI